MLLPALILYLYRPERWHPVLKLQFINIGAIPKSLRGFGVAKRRLGHEIDNLIHKFDN